MTDKDDIGFGKVSPDAAFKTTQWSLVLQAADGASPAGEAALNALCRTYWTPVYAFIRLQGLIHRRPVNPDDALEMTQEFLAEFVSKKKFSLANPERGRFRSFLIASLKNFLTGEWRREQAKKRGGGQRIYSLEEQQETESRCFVDPRDPGLTPDRAFEKEFALRLLDKVMEKLRAEFAAAGEQDKYEAIKDFLWSGRSKVSQTDAAAQLGIRPGTFNSLVFRAKRRYGALLRAEIAEIVDDPASIDDELRHLMEVLSS